MKISIAILVAAGAFSLAACSKSGDSQQTETATLEDIKTVDPNVPVAPASPAPATSNGVALNPAHGEPGHNCAIPVGAPLNETATNNDPNQPFNADVSVETSGGNPTPQTVAAGMNPAHGQPGHDCSVPVGAPLKK